jgi:hypothetical protein
MNALGITAIAETAGTYWNWALGVERRIVTSRSPVASMDSTGSNIQAIGEAMSGLRTRSTEAITSAAVQDRAVVKVTPSRRV